MEDFPTRPTLLARVRDPADAESWREFYQFYQPLLVRYLRRLGLKEHAADDIIQDVLRGCCTPSPTSPWAANPADSAATSGRSPSRPWSTRPGRSRRGDTRRRSGSGGFKRPVTPIAGKWTPSGTSWSASTGWTSPCRRVRTVTSPRSWACFEQRVLADRPAAAIAAELGIKSNAVFVYASRVLKAVRTECAALAEELGDDDGHDLPAR